MRMGCFQAVGAVGAINSIAVGAAGTINSMVARDKGAHIGPGKLRRKSGKKPASGRDSPSGAQIDLYGRFFCRCLRHERR